MSLIIPAFPFFVVPRFARSLVTTTGGPCPLQEELPLLPWFFLSPPASFWGFSGRMSPPRPLGSQTRAGFQQRCPHQVQVQLLQPSFIISHIRAPVAPTPSGITRAPESISRVMFNCAHTPGMPPCLINSSNYSFPPHFPAWAASLAHLQGHPGLPWFPPHSQPGSGATCRDQGQEEAQKKTGSFVALLLFYAQSTEQP